jgi:hypothetical protein
VWLEDWRPRTPEERALDPTEETAPAPAPAPAENPPPAEPAPDLAAAVAPPSPERPLPEPRPARPPPEPRPAPPPIESPPAPERAPAERRASAEPRDSAEPRARSPASTDAPPPATLPDVDWEKERRDAVRDVLEQRAHEREYLTFSLEDLVEEPEPEEPVLPPLTVDNCVIVKGKLQRFAALMMGRCVREARGDLFAAIKPAYLRAHPVCVETRPDNPGSFLSDGRRISTVKCELVANEEAE